MILGPFENLIRVPIVHIIDNDIDHLLTGQLLFGSHSHSLSFVVNGLADEALIAIDAR